MRSLMIGIMLFSSVITGCGKKEHMVLEQSTEQYKEDIDCEEIDVSYKEETIFDEESITLYPFQLYEFSEGVAWVKAKREDTSEEIYALINEDGQIQYIETEEIIYLSDCQDDLVYVNKFDSEDNVISEVINKNGQILFSSRDIENCIVLEYGNDMFIVGKYVSGFDVNEIQIGIVDRNGEWVCQLNTDKFIVNGRCIVDEINTGKENSLEYLGEGMFVAVNDFDMVFYNAVDNISFNIHGYWQLMGDYYNGKILAKNSRKETGVYSLDKNGNLTKISEGIDKYIDAYSVGDYSDGLWYYEGVFYNVDGVKVVDISLYKDQIEKAEYCYPVFKDGYSVIVLKGADGNPYYTVINLEGQFMFEPRILELAYDKEGSGSISKWDKTSPSKMKDCIFSIYENGKWTYYDVYGEHVSTVNIVTKDYATSVSTFDSETALLKCEDDVFCYIGMNGEIKLETLEVHKSLLE